MLTESPYKEHDYLKVFQEVTRLISMVHDSQRVMDLVVLRLPDLLDVDAATVRLLDDSTNTFVLQAAHGLSKEYLSRHIIDTHEVMEELRQGHPAITDLELVSDQVNRKWARCEGVKRVLSLPILYQGKVIGLLRLLTKKARDFTESETGFAMSLAEQVGIAITNSNLFQEQKHQLTLFQELRTISRLVNSTLDLDQILNSIVDKLPRIMGVKGCTIRLVDPATNRLEMAAASGLSREYLTRGSIRKEDSIFKVLKGEPVAIYDATSDPRVNYHKAISDEGIKSILAIPIRNELEIIGVMRLLTDKHRTFTPSEINFAITVAEEGGNAIQKARIYRKITLLFNQIEENERFLQTIMDSLWLSVLVLDPEKRVVMANQMFLEMQGFKEQDVLGQSYAQVSLWPVNDNDICPVNQVIRSGAPVAILESFDTHNSTSWFERHLSPIKGDNNTVEFVIEAVRDITDQRLLDQERMERMKLQGVIEMAGTAAHQLNSPLFAALGTAQLLLDDLTDKDHADDLEMIIRNLKNISDLTREMTDVTGYESRQYVGETNIVELKSKS